MINWIETVYSNSTEEFIKILNSDKSVKISIKLWKKSPVKSIFLRTAPDGEEILQSLTEYEEEDFFKYFSITLISKHKFISYRFVIITNDEYIYYYNNFGLSDSYPLDIFNFKFSITEPKIEWLENAVFYQIFPDRFYNGNESKNHKDNEYSYYGRTVRSKKWGELPDTFSHGFHLDFYNGDLEGIFKKIDYLEELGVNALYLNPIFLSPSNHKYDTQDFFTIDPHFGDNEFFSKLTTELHRRKFKIILDGVINHTGASSKWFNKDNFYEEPGAYQGKHSQYYDFYTFYNSQDEYEMWLGVKTLPKLNYKSDKLRNIIYRKPESVMQYWMAEPFNIDGWRIDVANMVARQGEYQEYFSVWWEIQKILKNKFPESYLMGEHFFDGSDLLNNDCLDGIMNYQGFYFPIYRWLTGKTDFRADMKGQNVSLKFDARMAVNQMKNFLSIIPFQKALKNFNLIDSHDRPRLISVLNSDKEKLKTAISALLTFPGIPSIYYGDEIGLEGMHDPDCRRCMIWEDSKWNKDILEFYKNLISLRKNSNALKKGGIKFLDSDETTIIYARTFKTELIITILISGTNKNNISISLIPMGIINATFKSFLFKSKEYICKNGILKISANTNIIILT